MRIITWNCSGALRKKTEQLDLLKADILVVQECEDPAESTKEYKEWAGDYLWIGSSKNKGIGIFPKKGNKVTSIKRQGIFEIEGIKSKSQSLKWSTNELKLFLSFKINNKYNALAVWTKGSDKEIFNYIGQFWKYLQIHREELSTEKTLIIGDFNSNSIWDKTDRWWSHTDVINELKDIDIESLYHYQTIELQGEESTATFYLHRKIEKPYHIDYVFCSKDILTKSKIEIGPVETWLKVSDHMPLIVEINN